MRDIMDRRELLGILGAGAAGLVAMGRGQAHADHEGPPEDHIKILGECAKICSEAASHCLDELRKGGRHAEHYAKAHEAAMDCQAFCVLAATLMARRSPVAQYAHPGAAAACRNFAVACEGLQDDVMKECVQACRECEEICRRMAASTR
jgi:hypothetical protein